MNSEWNWLGIGAWLITLAYFFFIINNTHHRKKHLLKLALSSKHQQSIKLASQNFEITAIEFIILFIALFGLMKMHHQPLLAHNSMTTTQCQPLQVAHSKINKKHLSQKPVYYYVAIKRTKAKSYKQTYDFMVNGKHIKASNKNALIGLKSNNLMHNDNVAYRVHKKLLRHAKFMKAHSAYAIRFTTIYSNTAKNGLGLLAGKKKAYYTVIKVPSKQWIYFNAHHLHKHVHKSVK